MNGYKRRKRREMIGLKYRDIDRDIVFIFLMAYEYSLSFTNLMKLFIISRKYFWTFLEICSPMIKMGVRKASILRKSAEKILICLKQRNLSYELLTPTEDRMMEALTWFIEDNFSDGEGCLHISQFKDVLFAKAYGKNGLIVAHNFENMLKNIDNIEYITMGDEKFFKTSRFLYYMEKYCGDMDIKELENLSVKEMTRRIMDGEEKLREKEARELASKQQ